MLYGKLSSRRGPAPVPRVSLELPLINHLPTLEGRTAKLAVGLWLMTPKMGFEPTQIDPKIFKKGWSQAGHSLSPFYS